MKSPGGGPKDIYPPIVEESDPPNYSTYFNSKKITLTFDEFVTVSDVVKEVFISPPLQSSPEIKTKGKSVIISFDEILLDSTTYSIFFGKAIKDLTEGNPLENYNYVFSTGAKIDSLSIVGEVMDAFELKPREDVLVMLYEDDNDTIPFDSLLYFVKPSYLTRTSPEGFFVINNISGAEYALIALADNNMSATYDNAEEEVAFLDSLIIPKYLAPILNDSLFSDSLAMADSLPPDLPLEDFYTLFMFDEFDSTQRLLGAEMTRKKVLRFIFRYPADDVIIKPLTEVSDDWMRKEWSKAHDTLRYYIMDESLDTISLKISLDTIVFDTVSYSLAEKEILQRKRDREAGQILKLLAPRLNPFPYFKDYIMVAGYPINESDFSQSVLVEGEDSISPAFSYTDEAGRYIRLDHELKEDTKYSLFFPDSIFTDILGRSNDTTIFTFNTNSESNYGTYKIHITNESPYEQILIQLLSENGKILREEMIDSDETISWDFLRPLKYMIKAIADINQNGIWDTGNFSERKQPEPVIFHPEILEVRESWSFDLEWVVVFK